MKANEAPEKIYLNWVNYPLEEMQVEYTRTDAFIEKAKEFLWEHIDGTDYHVNYILKEFENYMKGE